MAHFAPASGNRGRCAYPSVCSTIGRTENIMNRMASYLSEPDRCFRTVRHLLACVVVGLSAMAAAQAQTFYLVTDLGVLPGADSSAAASINASGQVVGTSSSSSQEAFVWANGQM